MIKNQKGVSLVEMLLVITVVSSLVFLLSSIPGALGLINKSKHQSTAKEIASKQIEDKRNISFANLVNDTTPISDYRLNSLPSGSGNVVVEDCPVSICTNSEKIKQVKVTVSWKMDNKEQQVVLTTLIGEGGINQ